MSRYRYDKPPRQVSTLNFRYRVDPELSRRRPSILMSHDRLGGAQCEIIPGYPPDIVFFALAGCRPCDCTGVLKFVFHDTFEQTREVQSTQTRAKHAMSCATAMRGATNHHTSFCLSRYAQTLCLPPCQKLQSQHHAASCRQITPSLQPILFQLQTSSSMTKLTLAK